MYNPQRHDPMGDIQVHLVVASRRVRESMDEARKLLDAGFPGPALVWAVRSVEIFVKAFLVTPVYFEGSEPKSWVKAFKRASKDFGSSNWKKAMAVVQAHYGPLDPMLTEDGADAYQVWEKFVVRMRGAVVHGEWVQVPPALAEQAIGYGEKMVHQLKMRIMVAKKHPLAGIVREALETARAEAGGSAGQTGE